jgi:hypothetical protein
LNAFEEGLDKPNSFDGILNLGLISFRNQRGNGTASRQINFGHRIHRMRILAKLTTEQEMCLSTELGTLTRRQYEALQEAPYIRMSQKMTFLPAEVSGIQRR